MGRVCSAGWFAVGWATWAVGCSQVTSKVVANEQEKERKKSVFCIQPFGLDLIILISALPSISIVSMDLMQQTAPSVVEVLHNKLWQAQSPLKDQNQ